MNPTLPSRGANRYTELTAFANTLLQIDENTGFKVSSRGWAQIKQHVLDDFENVQKETGILEPLEQALELLNRSE